MSKTIKFNIVLSVGRKEQLKKLYINGKEALRIIPLKRKGAKAWSCKSIVIPLLVIK